MLPCGIVPDRNSSIFGTSGNELLADADIKTSDLVSMERSHHIVELSLHFFPLFFGFKLHFAFNQLAILSRAIDLVFLFIGCDRQNLRMINVGVKATWNTDPDTISVFL